MFISRYAFIIIKRNAYIKVCFYHSYRCNFLNLNKISRADRGSDNYKLRPFTVPVATFNAGGVTCIQLAITPGTPTMERWNDIVLRSCEGEEREGYLLLMWEASTREYAGEHCDHKSPPPSPLQTTHPNLFFLQCTIEVLLLPHHIAHSPVHHPSFITAPLRLQTWCPLMVSVSGVHLIDVLAPHQ